MAPQPLTVFEQARVERIAGWKAEPPAYISAILDRLTHPLVAAAEHLVSPDKIASAVENAYASSEIQLHREKVARQAGVVDVRELRGKKLEHCHQLADDFALKASKGAMFWEQAAGNLVAALISLNALLTYCLKTIHTIGYCYGFGTEEPHERDYVLGILLIALASTLREKQEAFATLGKMEDMIFEEAFEDLIEDAIGEQIVQSAEIELIPLAGMLAAAMHSAVLTEHTAAVAQFCFEERWLKYHEKVDRIEPDRKRARSLVGRARARVANSIYWGAFGTTFLVCVPLAWIGSWFPARNVVYRGLADGRDDGSGDAERLVAKIRGEEVLRSRSEMVIESGGSMTAQQRLRGQRL